jgi:methylenetetrahydrofolate dehydrogenase (NADP+)/methenyltetrahydrofolate cyclohydrolase
MAVIIDGKKTSFEIKDEVKAEVEALAQRGRKVTLAVVLVGEDPASRIYVRNKKTACAYTGIVSQAYELPGETTEEELLALVRKLNADPEVNGILVQLPLPSQIDEETVIEAIDPRKDVDGFHPASVGALSIGLPGFISCTPAGIVEMLHRYHISADGKECVIVSRSNIIGKPMGMLMLRENATVTIAHSHTKDLRSVTKRADILITATGKPRMFDRSYVRDGAVVIDCGMDRDADGKLCGDVDYDNVLPLVSAITPVPGGVGPMTIAMLMHNCLESARMQGKC